MEEDAIGTTVNRRNLLAGTAAASVAFSMASPLLGAEPQSAPRSAAGVKPAGLTRATYVLVHGAGHGGWCYNRVARMLRDAGHDVHCPTLTGLGERAHLLTPSVSLETHIQDVVNVLEYEDLGNVILAGHSYGGAIITGVADRALERVGQLVFLDAAILAGGESVVDASPGIKILQSELRTVDGVDLVGWPDGRLARQIYGIKDDMDWAWARTRLTPHPWRTFEEKLVHRRSQEVAALPRTIIDCVETKKHLQGEALKRHTNADRVWEIDTGHDLMITEPQKLAGFLLALAKGRRNRA